MSQRHPGTRRTSQKSHDDADDAFVAGVLDVSTWAQRNQQLLTVVAVVAAIAVASGLYYRNYRSQLNQQAAEQLEVIHQSISIRDTEGAKVDLATFLDRFGGTPFEGEARMVLGELYLKSDDPQQAIAVLRPIGSTPREPVEFQAAALLAAAYEQENELDEAESTYLTIADRSDLDFQVRNALNSAARIRGTRGDAPGAITLYERILASLDANAPERSVYEMRIQELRSGTRA
jgi:predicted negative regulator of RcsB-dependent stress response